MTPGIALLVIGGILLVSGWKGSNIVDTFTGNFTKPDPSNDGNGSNAFAGDIQPPSQGGKWTAPAGGAHGFKGPDARLLNYLAGVAQNRFGLTITATTNGGHVANSFHYRGEAFDASGPADKMAAFAKFVFDDFHAGISELIHNGGKPGGYAIKDGHTVNGPSFYSSVWAGHANHVHVASAIPSYGGPH